jgi:hypothetical protein
MPDFRAETGIAETGILALQKKGLRGSRGSMTGTTPTGNVPGRGPWCAPGSDSRTYEVPLGLHTAGLID